MVDDAEGENAKAQRRSLRKRKRLSEDYRAVFGTDAGKRVMTDLHGRCVLDNVGFIQRASAVHMQGRTWVWARICKMTNMNDEELARLTRENV